MNHENTSPEGARKGIMSSSKRREIKPNSKLGKIIFNSKEPDEYSNWVQPVAKGLSSRVDAAQ